MVDNNFCRVYFVVSKGEYKMKKNIIDLADAVIHGKKSAMKKVQISSLQQVRN